MTIVRTIDDGNFEEKLSKVEQQYRDNIFMKNNKILFYETYMLLKNENTFNNEIKSAKNMHLRYWLNSLYTGNIELTYVEIAKLAMNNITHLPKCKCQVSKLIATSV